MILQAEEMPCTGESAKERPDSPKTYKHFQMDLGFGFICCHSSQYKDDAQI